MKLETLALHAGYAGDPTTRAATTPIYQTTSFTFDNTQHGADLFDLKVVGNIYTRIMNPTQAVLEQRLAEMEGGIGALCLASGMAAITYSIQCIADVGCNIVSTSQLYGGTYNLFAHTFPRQGIEVRFASHDDYAGLEALIDDNTRALFCESIGNPAGNVVDIVTLAEIAHRHGVPLIVDNTVPTPFLCKPFELGADIVIHSLTKYIGGHGTSDCSSPWPAARRSWPRRSMVRPKWWPRPRPASSRRIVAPPQWRAPSRHCSRHHRSGLRHGALPNGSAGTIPHAASWKYFVAQSLVRAEASARSGTWPPSCTGAQNRPDS